MQGRRVRFNGQAAEAMKEDLALALQLVKLLSDVFEGAKFTLDSWANQLEDLQKTAEEACSKAMEAESKKGGYLKTLGDAKSHHRRDQGKYDECVRQISALSFAGSGPGDADYDNLVERRDKLSDSLDQWQRSIFDCRDSITALDEEIDGYVRTVKDCADDYEEFGKSYANQIGDCQSELQKAASRYGSVSEWQTAVSGTQAVGYGVLMGISKTHGAHASEEFIRIPWAEQALDDIGLATGDGWLDKVFPASGSASGMAGGAVVTGIKGSVVGAVIGGVCDSVSTYGSRREKYGEEIAKQDAIAHGVISFGSGVGAGVVGSVVTSVATSAMTGAATGATVGSVGTLPGIAIGAIVGFVVGLAAGVALPKAYDRYVQRED